MSTTKGNRVNKLALVLISLTLLCISLPSSAWAEYTYTEIIPPGWQGASAHAINDGGDIVGWGADASGVEMGFLYSGGSYTTIIPPGWQEANANAINNNGAIVGWGADASGVEMGFLYSGGNYTEIIPPGWQWAAANAINDGGDIVGEGEDANGIEKGFMAIAYSISGNVIVKSTKAPLSGVTMTLGGASSATTVTDTNGNYSFSGLTPNKYTVTPTKSGYKFSPKSKTVKVKNKNVTNKNFKGKLL